MKPILIIIALLLSFTLVYASNSGPKLIVAAHIDLGTVKVGEIREQSITIQNSGQADLVINSITSDCPCTGFQIQEKDGEYQPWRSETKITVQPGAKVELKLIFDPNKTKYRGAFKKLIVIGTNDPQAPLKRVEMAGEIMESPGENRP